MIEDPDAPRGWSVDIFAKFWAKPNLAWVKYSCTPDIVAYWPWSPKPVHGVEEYTKGLAAVLIIVPDITLEVAEHATAGESVFVRWIARGTGGKGRFELNGVDRFLVRNNLVYETRVFFDSARFRSAIGRFRVASRLLQVAIRR